MAGTGTKDIKRRIKSVNSTKQITKAMELVSTAKLRRRKKVLESTKPYYQKVMQTVKHILANEKNTPHKYIAERQVDKVLYIVITSDRGLAGGYNINAVKTAYQHFSVQAIHAKIFAIGKYATDFFYREKVDIVENIQGISEDPSFDNAKYIAKRALAMYREGDIDKICLVYTRLESTIVQLPVLIELLPVSVDEAEAYAEDEQTDELMNYQPNAEVVLDYLIPKYLESTIYGGLIESSASEQAARRMAMENATDNAEDMIEELTLSFNQARQAAITQEISEIVGGANAFD